MDLATMGNLAGTVGFPIGISIIVIYILYRFFKVVLYRF